MILNQIGVELALDDFGTGYSSMQYLKQFPVSRIKIDRSFLENLHVDSRACAIVRSIIELAHNLGIKVIAEGVETEQQYSLLRDLGCDEFQGYLICRPSEPEAAITWWNALRRNNLRLIHNAVN